MEDAGQKQKDRRMPAYRAAPLGDNHDSGSRYITLDLLAMRRVKNMKLVRECGLHHLSIEDRDIWLADDEIKALECILKDYNADTNNFKYR